MKLRLLVAFLAIVLMLTTDVFPTYAQTAKDAQTPNNGQTTNGGQAGKTADEDLGSITGMVVKMTESAPLRKARATLRSVDDPTRSISASTDASGVFTFKKIEPGAYHLNVKRNG